jgi:hypothetical protein
MIRSPVIPRIASAREFNSTSRLVFEMASSICEGAPVAADRLQTHASKCFLDAGSPHCLHYDFTLRSVLVANKLYDLDKRSLVGGTT